MPGRSDDFILDPEDMVAGNSTDVLEKMGDTEESGPLDERVLTEPAAAPSPQTVVTETESESESGVSSSLVEKVLEGEYTDPTDFYSGIDAAPRKQYATYEDELADKKATDTEVAPQSDFGMDDPSGGATDRSIKPYYKPLGSEAYDVLRMRYYGERRFIDAARKEGYKDGDILTYLLRDEARRRALAGGDKDALKEIDEYYERDKYKVQLENALDYLQDETLGKLYGEPPEVIHKMRSASKLLKKSLTEIFFNADTKRAALEQVKAWESWSDALLSQGRLVLARHRMSVIDYKYGDKEFPPEIQKEYDELAKTVQQESMRYSTSYAQTVWGSLTRFFGQSLLDPIMTMGETAMDAPATLFIKFPRLFKNVAGWIMDTEMKNLAPGYKSNRKLSISDMRDAIDVLELVTTAVSAGSAVWGKAAANAPLKNRLVTALWRGTGREAFYSATRGEQSGVLQDLRENAKDENGKPLDRETAYMISLAAGTVNGMIEVWNRDLVMAPLARMFPLITTAKAAGSGGILKAIGLGNIKKSLDGYASQFGRGGFIGFLKAFGAIAAKAAGEGVVGLSSEAGEELLQGTVQRGASYVGTEMAKGRTAGEAWGTIPWSEAVAGGVSDFVEAVADMGPAFLMQGIFLNAVPSMWGKYRYNARPDVKAYYERYEAAKAKGAVEDGDLPNEPTKAVQPQAEAPADQAAPQTTAQAEEQTSTQPAERPAAQTEEQPLPETETAYDAERKEVEAAFGTEETQTEEEEVPNTFSDYCYISGEDYDAYRKTLSAEDQAKLDAALGIDPNAERLSTGEIMLRRHRYERNLGNFPGMAAALAENYRKDMSAMTRREAANVIAKVNESIIDAYEQDETPFGKDAHAAEADLAKRIEAMNVDSELSGKAAKVITHYAYRTASRMNEEGGSVKTSQILQNLKFKRREGEAQGAITVAWNPETQADETLGSVDISNDSLLNVVQTIVLGQHANASTIFHEFGHVMLNDLWHLAHMKNAPQSIKDELATVLRVLGVSDIESAFGVPLVTLDEATQERVRNAHEMFARSFEMYLRDGVAPTGLQKVFNRIREWLVDIYKTIRDLGFDELLPNELRDVFDDLLMAPEHVYAPNGTAQAHTQTIGGVNTFEQRSYTQEEIDSFIEKVVNKEIEEIPVDQSLVAKLEKASPEELLSEAGEMIESYIGKTIIDPLGNKVYFEPGNTETPRKYALHLIAGKDAAENDDLSKVRDKRVYGLLVAPQTIKTPVAITRQENGRKLYLGLYQYGDYGLSNGIVIGVEEGQDGRIVTAFIAAGEKRDKKAAYAFIKKHLLNAQEVLYLRGGLSPYQRPPTDQHRSSADTSLSMSGTQILSQDSGENNPNVFNQSAAPKSYAKLTDLEKTAWDEGSQGLNEDELRKINAGNIKTIRGFVNSYSSMPDLNEYAVAALAGYAKKGWYARSAIALFSVFGDETDRFTALLAATSPQCSVETNLMNSLKVWAAWKEWTKAHPDWEKLDDVEKRRAVIQLMRDNVQQADQVEGSESKKKAKKESQIDKDTGEKLGPVLGAWVNNTVRALTDPNAAETIHSGAKVNSFKYNLRGDLSYVTNDTWMAKFIGRLQKIFGGGEYKPENADPGYSSGYLAMNAKVRLAAELLTKLTGEEWAPAEVQETIWSWAKAISDYAKNLAKTQQKEYNKKGKKGEAPVTPSFRELIESGVITDELVGSTVDFAQLFTQGDGVNDYRAVLEEAGYGEQLEKLDKEVAASDAERRGSQPGADRGAVPDVHAGMVARWDAVEGGREILSRVADRLDASFRGEDEIHKKLLAVRSQFGAFFGSRDAYADGYQNRGDLSYTDGQLLSGGTQEFSAPYTVNRGREEPGRHDRSSGYVEFDLGLKNPVKVRAAEYVLDRGVAANLKEVFAATPRFYELAMDEKNIAKSASAFRRALIRGMESQGPWGLCVEVKSLKTYMNQSEDPEAPKIARLVLAEGARAGFAVDENGGIVSAFSMKGAPIVDGKELKANEDGKYPKVVQAMLLLAVQMGGRHMDCFDTVLPETYSHMGFRAVSRCAFSWEFRPKGWTTKTTKQYSMFNNGAPDVVFLVYDPGYTGLYKPGEGVMCSDYGAASKVVTQEIAKLREQSQALAQQPAQTFNQDAVANSIGDTEHGYGVAVNEKGQLVGGSNRYEQSAWHGTGENTVIERFSREKSNSGAGGNAHGAGALYAARDRLVAAGYREQMSNTEFLFTKNGQKIDPKLAGALSRHVNSIRNVAADGLALDEDSRVLKDLADVQELAKGTRAGKTFMARLISQYQTLLDRIDADPEMTPQDFYNLRNEAPFRDDDMAPSNIADAYHAATQNAIRAGKPAATIEDVRHVIEEGLLPNKLWRDELYADAELLANADLTGIRAEARQSGALYEVEIPENDVLLNEQLRFSAQPKVVKEGIRAAFEKLTHEQKRDFAENILPWSEAKDEVFQSKASYIKTLLDYLNKPVDYINGLFKDISDPRAIPPKVLNARSVLKNYFGYTDAQIDTFSATRKAAMAEAEKAIANVDETRARLQEQYEKEHAAEIAREEAFFKKALFTKLRNSRTIEGRDIYDAFAYALRGDNFENQMAASLALSDAGIKGITYDGAQDGRCFVIFDEDAIEIINRYEQQARQHEQDQLNMFKDHSLEDLYEEDQLADDRIAELERESEDAEFSRVDDASWRAVTLGDSEPPEWLTRSSIVADTPKRDELQLKARSALTAFIRNHGGLSYENVLGVWGKSEAEGLRKRDPGLFRKDSTLRFEEIPAEYAHETGEQVGDVNALYELLMSRPEGQTTGLHDVPFTDDNLAWMMYGMDDKDIVAYARERRKAVQAELKTADEAAAPALRDELDLIKEVISEMGGRRKRTVDPEQAALKAEMKARQAEIREAEKRGRAEGRAAERARASERIAALKEKHKARVAEIREQYKERMGEQRRKDREKVKLMREQQRQRDQMKKQIKRIIKHITKMGNDKHVRWGVKQELERLLAQYTLKNVSPKRLAKAQALADYVKENPDVKTEDFTRSEQELLHMLETTRLSEMKLEDLLKLEAEVEEVHHRGRVEYEQWKQATDVRRAGMFEELLKSIGRIPQRSSKVVRDVRDLRKEYKGVKGMLQKAGDWTYAATLGAQRLFDWIGNGGGQYDSAMTKYFMDMVNEARDEELRHVLERRANIEGLMKDLGISFYDLSKSRVVDGEAYSVDQLLSIYALLKNQKGHDALIYGNFRGLGNQAEAHAARCVQALTGSERALADAIIDDFDKSFDRLNERFIDVYNEAMDKEENYTPMHRLEYSSRQGLVDAESAETLEGKAARAGQRAMLEKGFLHKRQEINQNGQRAVDLGLVDLWSDQVSAQEHTAAFAKVAGDLGSVLGRAGGADGRMTIGKAITLKYGTEAWKSVVGYTNLVIQNDRQIAHSALNSVTRAIGRHMSIAYLCGSLSTMLKQTLSLPRVLISAGFTQVFAEIGKFAIHPKEYIAEVKRLDPQMADRASNAFYKLIQIDPGKINELSYRYQQLLDLGMKHISLCDVVTASICWKAVYNACIKRNMSQQQAIREAQRAVALTQQTPQAKDQPALWQQSATGIAKLMMIFTNDSAQVWGMTMYDMAQRIKSGNVPRIAYNVAALTLGAMLLGMVTDGPPDDDDDENWLEWTGRVMTRQYISSVPVIGKELFTAYDSILNNKPTGNTSSALVAPFAKIMRGAKDMMSTDSSQYTKSGVTKFERGAWQLTEGFALLTGLFPVTAAKRTLTALRSDSLGDAFRAMLAMRRDVKRARRGMF